MRIQLGPLVASFPTYAFLLVTLLLSFGEEKLFPAHGLHVVVRTRSTILYERTTGKASRVLGRSAEALSWNPETNPSSRIDFWMLTNWFAPV